MTTPLLPEDALATLRRAGLATRVDAAAFAAACDAERDGAPLHALGLPVQFHVHPDTEAAAAGIFRLDGLTDSHREHAPTCAVCRDNLRRAADEGVLPDEFRPLLGA